MLDWVEYTKFFAGLLGIVDPIGTIPIFISLTATQPPAGRLRSARVAAVAAGLVLLAALLTGDAILRFFGIRIASFRVGGGILILLMSISMMQARVSRVRQTEEEAQDTAEKDAVAVVPLGIPLLAGPGAISAVILYAQRDPSAAHHLILGAGILIVTAVTWASFRAAPYLASVLGRTGINIVTRIMGLIMAAIGVEFIADGLKQLLPGLK